MFVGLALALAGGPAFAADPGVPVAADLDRQVAIAEISAALRFSVPTQRILFTNDDYIEACGMKARTGRAFPRLRSAPAPRTLEGLLRLAPGATGMDAARTFQGAMLYETTVRLDGVVLMTSPGWQGPL